MSHICLNSRMLIRGGKVVNADKSMEADVYIENGIIKQVSRYIYGILLLNLIFVL